MYKVVVPANVYAGQSFKIQVNGQLMQVTCPPSAGPGHTITVNVPSAVPMAQATGMLDPIQIFSDADSQRKGYLTAYDLQRVLGQCGYVNFQLKTCQMMIRIYDPNRTGNLDRSSFVALWGYLQQWKTSFDTLDKDRSGSIDRKELESCIENFGYSFSPQFVNMLLSIYDQDRSNAISLDEFIQLFSELHCLTEAFKVRDVNRNGTATFQYEDFLTAVYSIHL